MSSLEKTWSLRSRKKRLQLRQQRHWRTSSCSSHRAQCMTSRERLKRYTVLNWNALSRSWKNPLPLHSYSIISNTVFNDYVFNSRKLWCWTMTTLRRGVVAKFVCSLPIPSREGSGLIYSATLETQHRQSGSTSLGAVRATFKPTHVFTAKGRSNRLLFTI